MVDPIAILVVLVVLVMASIGLAVVWSMLVAWWRGRQAARQGRSPADPDKETPPDGWPAYAKAECAECGFTWRRRLDDFRPCPACDGTGVRRG